METAIVWGWMLTAQASGLGVIIDPNYKTETECEQVATEFAAKYPDYSVECTPTWKPDTPPKKRVVRYRRR